MTDSEQVRVADVRMGALERLPWRRIILTVVAVAVIAFVVIGSYQTITSGKFDGEFWAEQAILGLSQGAILGLVALGYSLVYGILRMINFAHGEVFMAGAFISFFFADYFAKSGFLGTDPWVSLAILMTVSAVVSVGVAVLLERLAYRPLRNAPRLVPLITAIGASLFLQNAFRGFFGPQPRGYPSIPALEGAFTIGSIDIKKVDALVLVVAVIGMVALQLFVTRTRTGRSMRAVAEDPEIASLMGIDVDRIIVVTFIVGAVLAGVAGVLYAISFTQVIFTMGFRLGIAAFTAAVLGGIGSIAGSVLGGFLIGTLGAIGPPLILSGLGVPSPFSIRDAFVFLVLVLVLVFRPGGLLGSGESEKV